MSENTKTNIRAIKLSDEVYKKVQFIATSKKQSAHGTMVEMIETYVDAWENDRALFRNRSLLNLLETNSFILLAFLKSIAGSDEKFTKLLASALRGQQRYGNIDEYLNQQLK